MDGVDIGVGDGELERNDDRDVAGDGVQDGVGDAVGETDIGVMMVLLTASGTAFVIILEALRHSPGM